jgi:hypothetical protein
LTAFVKFEEYLTGFIESNPFGALIVELGLVVSGIATFRIALAAVGLAAGAKAAAGAAAGAEGAAAGAAVGLSGLGWLGLAGLGLGSWYLKTEYGDPRQEKLLKKYDEEHPGRKPEDQPGLTDEQRENLKNMWGGRGRLGYDPTKQTPAPELTSPLVRHLRF